MKARFIFNPRSGRNRGNPALRDMAIKFITKSAWDATVVTTGHPRHATELARRAVDDGCGLVVAIGGDGTMNEVASALVGTTVVFGLIPCGSGNGLGRHLGIPAGSDAFSILRQGRPRAIDTGRLNGRPFFCVAGTGFEALIAARFGKLTNRGFTGYIRTSASAWWNYRPETYSIHHTHGTDRITAFSLAVANSDQYGNNAFIAPGARVDDGLLDLTAIPPVGPLNSLPLLWRLFRGSLDGAASVLRRREQTYVIERATEGWIHTDGEPRIEPARLELSALPGSLLVMAPAVSRQAAAKAPA